MDECCHVTMQTRRHDTDERGSSMEPRSNLHVAAVVAAAAAAEPPTTSRKEER